MANPDILITPGQGTIGFSGTNTGTIQLRVAESGDIHFEGDQGSLLSLSDDLSDSLFSVNDAAGMPVFEVFADDTIKAYRNNEAKLEIDPDNNRIRLRDNLLISGDLTVSGSFTQTNVSGTSGYFGKVGIGYSDNFHPDARLVVGQNATNGFAIIAGSDNVGVAPQISNSQTKVVRIGMPHYTITEEPVTLMTATSSSSKTDIHIGGGTAYGNSTENMYLRTAASHTTTKGTTALYINNNQQVVVGSLGGLTTAAGLGAALTVSGDASITGELKVDSAGVFRGEGLRDGSWHRGLEITTQNSNFASLYFGGQSTTKYSALVWTSSVDGNVGNKRGAQIFGHPSSSTNTDLKFGTNNAVGTSNPTTKMIIRGDGKVGIGTTGPSSELTISGSDGRPTIRLAGEKRGSDGNFADIYASNNAQDGEAQISFRRVGANDATEMLFYTSAAGGSMTEQVRIDSAGDVGIGTTAPDEKLHIEGAGNTKLLLESTANHAELVIKSENNTYSPYVVFKDAGADRYYIQCNPADRLMFRPQGTSDESKWIVFNHQGHVGIGTENPGPFKLLVSGKNTHTVARFAGPSATTSGSASYSTVIIGDTDAGVSYGATKDSTFSELQIRARNDAGAGYEAARIALDGYEGRAVGVFFVDDDYQTSKEWFAGMPYQGYAEYFQIGRGTNSNNFAVQRQGAILTVRDAAMGGGNGQVLIGGDARGTSQYAGSTLTVSGDTNITGELRVKEGIYVSDGASAGSAYIQLGNSSDYTNFTSAQLHLAGGTNAGFQTVGSRKIFLSDYDNDGSTNGVTLFECIDENQNVDIRFLGGSGSSLPGRNYFRGRVGIGTSVPSELLEVDGNIRLGDGTHRNIIGPTNATLGIYANPNDANEGIKFSTDGGTTIEMFLEDGGNVGIGPDLDPTSRLHVNSASSEFTLRLSSTASRAGMVIDHPSSTNIMGSALVLASDDTYRLGTASYYHVSMNQAGQTQLFGGGSAALTVDTNQRVGIGTADPQGVDLHVNGSAIVSGTLYVKNDQIWEDANSTDIIAKLHDNNDDGVFDIYQNNSVVNRIHGNGASYFKGGNVGIGTGSPAGKLEIVGSDGTVAGTPDGDVEELVIRNNDRCGIQLLSAESAGKTSQIMFGSASDVNAANVKWSYNDKLLTISTQNAAGEVALRSANGVEAVRIDTGGKVGIGTASPGSILHLKDSVVGVGGPTITFEDSSGGTQTATIKYDQAGQNTFTFATQYQSPSSENKIQFAPADNIAMTIRGGTNTAGDGTVGIGTQTPTGTLHVYQSGDIRPAFLVEGSQGSLFSVEDTLTGSLMSVNDIAGLPVFEAFDDGTIVMGQYNSGDLVVTGNKVGIGTTSPDKLLTVESTTSPIIGLYSTYSDSNARNWAIATNNTAYGDFTLSNSAAQGGNPNVVKVTILKDGNVGIGTTNPESFSNYTAVTVSNSTGGQLYFKSTTSSVTAYAGADSNGAYFASKTNHPLRLRTNNTDKLFIEAGGSVGIGTTNPDTQLDLSQSVDGPLAINIHNQSTNAAADSAISFETHGQFDFSIGLDRSLGTFSMCRNATLGTNEIVRIDPAGTISAPTVTIDADVQRVGIGTTNPEYLLDIGGDTASTNRTIRMRQNNGGTAIRIGAGGGGNDVTLLRIDGESTNSFGESDAGQYGFSIKYMGSRSSDANSLSIFSDNQNAGSQVEAFTMFQGGSIGIGTASPQGVKLHVNGSTIVSGTLYVKNDQVWYDANSTDVIAKLHDNNDDGIFDIYQNNSVVNRIHGNGNSYFKGGNVGIGTDNPAARLHITSDGSHDEGAEIALRHNNNNTTDVVSTISFQNNAGQVAKIAGETVGANNNGVITFHTDDAGTSTEAMRIDSSQNVGIGTTIPRAVLHVNGDASISGELKVDEDVTVSANILANNFYPADHIYHQGDTNTYIQFSDDKIDLYAGSLRFITCEEAGTDAVIINENSVDMNFRVESNGQGNMLLVDGGTDRVGIATSAPTKTFHVRYSTDNSSAILADGLPGGGAGHGVLINNVATNVNSFANLDFRANDADGRIAYTYEANNQGSFHFIADNGSAPAIAMTIKSNANVGIGTTLPSGRLHVENNSTGIIVANDQITGNAFEVFGAQGNLLTVTDDLSDSLFSVNDAAGMPVFEVFADDTIKSYRNNESKLEVDPDNNRIRLRDNVNISGLTTITGGAVVGGGTRFTAGGTHELSINLGVGDCIGIGASDSALNYFRRYSAINETLQLQTYAGANNGIFSMQPYGGEIHIGTNNGTAALGSLLAVDGDVQITGALRAGANSAIAGGHILRSTQNTDDPTVKVQNLTSGGSATASLRLTNVSNGLELKHFGASHSSFASDCQIKALSSSANIRFHYNGGNNFILASDGTVQVASSIQHIGDTDTRISFSTNQIVIAAGGTNENTLTATSTTFNSDNRNVDFAVHGDTSSNLIYVDAGTEVVGIGGAPNRADVCLELNPTATDDAFIAFDGTSASDESKSLQGTTSSAGHSLQGYIRVLINNTTRWIPFYD